MIQYINNFMIKENKNQINKNKLKHKKYNKNNNIQNNRSSKNKQKYNSNNKIKNKMIKFQNNLELVNNNSNNNL